jgi:hypothetical protein
MGMPSPQSCGHDGSPFLPPCHTGWIDVADVRAQSTLATSWVLHRLDGGEVETPSMSCPTLVVGFEWPLQFSPMV